MLRGCIESIDYVHFIFIFLVLSLIFWERYEAMHEAGSCSIARIQDPDMWRRKNIQSTLKSLIRWEMSTTQQAAYAWPSQLSCPYSYQQKTISDQNRIKTQQKKNEAKRQGAVAVKYARHHKDSAVFQLSSGTGAQCRQDEAARLAALYWTCLLPLITCTCVRTATSSSEFSNPHLRSWALFTHTWSPYLDRQNVREITLPH